MNVSLYRDKVILFFLFVIIPFIPGITHSENLNTLPVADFIQKYIDSTDIDKGWKEIERSEGISHYAKEIKGNDLNAYMGVCVINSSLETIYSIMSNVSEHTKWIKYCSTSTYVEKNSENDSYQYYDFNVPWPLMNRDIVVHCTTKTDWSNGKIIIYSEAVKEPLIPVKKNHIRITDSKQKWVLEQIAPNKTKVTLVSVTTMKEPVPRILNKIVSQTIPGTSLKNLKKLSTDKFNESPKFVVNDSTKTDQIALH